MVKPIPSRFNPDLMARDGTRFAVKLPLSQFTRLSPLLVSGSGAMRAQFRFSRRRDHVLIAGRLEVDYPVRCQRCLEPMNVVVQEPFEFVFVDNESEARRLPEELDPVVLDDTGQIHVIDLFEDELLLRLPAVPKHAPGDACAPGNYQSGDELPATEPDRQRPFDILKNLDIH